MGSDDDRRLAALQQQRRQRGLTPNPLQGIQNVAADALVSKLMIIQAGLREETSRVDPDKMTTLENLSAFRELSEVWGTTPQQ